MSISEPKGKLKSITTQEIVDAIQALIDLRIEAEKHGPTLGSKDQIEIARRTIADGLRFHSAAKGIIVGDQK